MNARDKAKRYVQEGKTFPLKKTESLEIWGVEGDTGVHQVQYDRYKDIYSCNCRNIRNSPCSHTQAVEMEKFRKLASGHETLLRAIGTL